MPRPGRVDLSKTAPDLDLHKQTGDYATSHGLDIMNAQKFQLRYSQVEDRILIIVTDENNHDEVFGLTRRLVKRLVPGLEKVLRQAGHLVQAQTPDTQSPAPAPTPAETAAFSAQRREQAARAASSGEAPPPIEDPGPAPVAVPSHLVTRLRVQAQGKGRHLLHITDGVTSLNIPLTDEQLAQFSHGIVTVLDNADWDLPAIATGEPDEESPAVFGGTTLDITADSPSKYRH